MAVSLGEVTLPKNMILSGYYSQHSLTGTYRRAIQGPLLIHEAPLVEGMPLNLSTGGNDGWVTLAQYQSIAALQSLHSTLSLIYGSITVNVRFRVNDPPYIQFELLTPRQNPASTDYLQGIIKLITV
jgi:hypothetical protein